MPYEGLKIDQALLQQLEDASANGVVEAVLTFHSDDPKRPTPAAERTKELTAAVLKRAEDETGDAAERVNVFKHLGAFAVKATPTFIQHLLNQPEVASAVANRQKHRTLEAAV